MKIAMILDNPLNPDNRVEKEAESLVKAGHEVTILCKMAENLDTEESRNGYKIKRIFRYNLGTSVLVEKYLLAHFDLMNAVNESYDVYHCHDTETWPIGYILSQRDNAKFICDSHEYFPDYIIRETYNDEIKFKASQMLIGIRGNYIRYADAVITVTDTIAEKLYDEYKLKEKPIALYNTKLYKYRVNKKKDLLRAQFQIDESKKILFFQGNIDYSRGMEYIIESLKYIKSDVLFLIAGVCTKEYLNELLDFAKKHKVEEKFRYIGFLDNKRLIEYTASADILVYYPRNSVLNMEYTIPNKFFDYIFASRPIILRDFDVYKEFMDKYDLGFTCTDTYDIAEKIDALLTDTTLYNKKVDNCINSQAELSWEKQEEKLIKLYSKL